MAQFIFNIWRDGILFLRSEECFFAYEDALEQGEEVKEYYEMYEDAEGETFTVEVVRIVKW